MRSLALPATGADPGSGPVFRFKLDRAACRCGTCLHSGMCIRPRLGEFPGNMETAVRKSLAESSFFRLADHLSSLLLVLGVFVDCMFEYIDQLILILCGPSLSGHINTVARGSA